MERKNLIGSRLAEMCSERNISYKQLADQLNEHGLKITERELLLIESGERRVTDIELLAITEFLGVSADSLISCKV